MHLIIFELEAKDPVVKLKVNRFLKRIRARMIIRGVWEHQRATFLITLASWIRNLGGKAIVLEKKVVY